MTEAQFLHIKLDTIKKLGTTCESQKTEVNRTKLFFYAITKYGYAILLNMEESINHIATHTTV